MRAVLLIACFALLLPVAGCAPQYRGGYGIEADAAHAMPVAEAQAGLARLGFRPGPVDGIYGPQTRAAVIDYQRVRGLRDTGRIDLAFARRLRADVAALPPRPAAGPAAEDERIARLPDGAAGPVLDPTAVPGETGTDAVEPLPGGAPPVGPAPELFYRRDTHDPSLVAASETRPEDLRAVRYAEIDLDGDGDLDVIWNNTAERYCGSSGCSFDIYFRQGAGWRPVARLLAFEVEAAAGRTRGVRDILVTGRRGSAIWQWNGRHYAPAG